MILITWKVTVITRDDETIAVNAEVFIINKKLDYLFICLDIHDSLSKEWLTKHPSTTSFWLESCFIVIK